MTLHRDNVVTGTARLACGAWSRAVACLIAFGAFLVVAECHGQADVTVPAGSRPTSVGESAESLPSMKTDASEEPIYGLLKSGDGTLVPLPPGTKYEDYLSWLSARRGSGYGINSVEITGSNRHSKAESTIQLKAVVKIVVHRENEWVRVPLDFREALLDQVRHEGVGLASYEPFSKENGHSWSLQGRGEHELQLELIVPLAIGSDETRLTLSTPTNAATTRLDLALPDSVTATASEGLIRTSESSEGGDDNSIEWIGIGGKIDLTWRPRPTLSDPEDLSVATTIVPTVSGKTLQLRARQSITPREGQVSTIQVRLPEGFSLAGVEGALLRPNSERLFENGRLVSVELMDAAKSTFELTWKATAPLPSSGELTINGFRVEGVPAAAQTGQLFLEDRPSAYSIEVIGDSSMGISRVEMVEPAPTAVAAAYSFSSQPYSVRLKIEPVVPVFTVSPDLRFDILSDRIELLANFGVEVQKGELREMRLLWPATGWSIPSIRAGRVQEATRNSKGEPPIELLVSSGSAPVDVPLRFDFPLRASRARTDSSQRLSVPIPHLEGAAQQAVKASHNEVVICVRHPTNLRVEVLDEDGMPLKPFDRMSRPNYNPPEVQNNERVDLFLAPADTQEVSFRVQRLSQEIRNYEVLSVRPRGDNLHIEQRIDYDIRNEPLSRVRFLASEALISQGLELVDSSNTKLVPTIVRSREDGLAEVQVDFGTSVIGPISVTANFDVAVPTSSNNLIETSLPKLQPLDGVADPSQLEVWALPRHHLRLLSNDWTRHHSTYNDGQLHWISNGVPDAKIAIEMSPKAEAEYSRVTIEKLLFRSFIDREGRTSTLVDCRIPSPPESLTLRFPKGVVPRAFRWQGRNISATVVSQDEDEFVIEVFLRAAGRGEPILSFETAAEGRVALDFLEKYELADIGFAEEVQVQQTLWRLTLPESQHLFRGPGNYTPGFKWEFHSGLWARSAEKPFSDVGLWLGADATFSDIDSTRGHSYVFIRPDRPRPLKFTAISRSLVVLLGAGLSIVLGYTFANGLIPRPRVATMVLAVLLLLCWAFFANQVLIFLQPALFGLVLVAGAVFAERMLQQRQDGVATAQPASAVDLVTILPGEGSTSGPPAAIGSEEPTVLRSGRPIEQLSSHRGP